MTSLREARDEHGWTKAKLVALIEQTARARGVRLNRTTTSLGREVSYWESGSRSPQEPVLGILCAVYGRSAQELGLSPAPNLARSDVGLTYDPHLLDAIDTLSKVAAFDATRHTCIVNGTYSPDALTAACVDWLFSDSLFDTSGSTRVTHAEVATVRSATAVFDELDRARGGAASRTQAVEFLRDKVLPLLSRVGDDAMGRDLLSAASALCEVIGWMAYDLEEHGVAQRYFVQALRLAKDGAEPSYGAYVLSTMSHQALYLRQARQAIRLASAAKANAGDVHMVRAEACMLSARAHASLGNERACSSALADAEAAFSAATPDNTPTWASHWTEAVFSAYLGTCWVDLKKADLAYSILKPAWEAAAGQPRRRAYSTGQLARVALLRGDVEEAAHLGIMTVEALAESLSRRSVRVVRDVAEGLRKHAGQKHVRNFDERARVVLNG